MVNFRRSILWISLVLLLLLTIFSIYGAFVGTQRAQEFFNTVPLAVYWLVFAGILLVSLYSFRRLINVPALLMIHVGFVLVIAGGMWGSQGGLDFQKKLFGSDKIKTGQMVIYENGSESRVIRPDSRLGYAMDFNNKVVIYESPDPHSEPVILEDTDERIFTLPFSIRLRDFRMDYYEPAGKLERLFVEVNDDSEKRWLIEPVEQGAEYELDNGYTLTIIGKFGDLKIESSDQETVAYEGPNPGENPALRLLIKAPDGTEQRNFAFARFPGFMTEDSKYKFTYQSTEQMGMVKDYFSDLEVIEDGKVVKSKTIQVNDPLFYHGYHFYQHSYDSRDGRYTVLMVASDSGLYVVFAGYWLISIGFILHMWIVPAMKKFRSGINGGEDGN